MKRTEMSRGKGFKRPEASPTYRPKRCKACTEQFTPTRKMQAVCGVACSMAHASRIRSKQEAATTRAQKEAAKPRGDLVREAQTAFNAWIRERDALLPCVSCGRHHDGQYHAGHYLTTGARPELRFTETNVHKQCAPCNLHLHGNPVMFRVELVRRVGLPEVERLEGPRSPCKFTPDQLRGIRNDYRARTRALKKESR